MKMKLRTVKFIFKEGFSNFLRNKLMFFASCAVIMAALIILGVFILIILNLDENVKALNEKPQIQIYCRFDLTDAEVDQLESEILAEDGVRELTRISKEEAYARAREILGANSDILDGMGSDFLPISFILKHSDPSQIDDFVTDLEQNTLIAKISYPKRTIDLITKVSGWTKAFGAVLTGIPILFAVFIISNTIRLAVSERLGEISIMRYIGATEGIIRWPFIVEGMITGLIGATAAFLATGFGYKLVEENFNMEMAGLADGLFRLVNIGNVSPFLLMLFMAIGIGVGAVGSARSIQKFLRV